ncbi:MULTISPECIES: hypothetical protein [unclassified Pseudomonas]|uniref:hypothetical protein n=1 Tax=unclassified Pseudomonas TaxID=196821 RepID=UPI001F5897A9|nr:MULTISPECIES: hypothetical protein [unclassified Pseudomonas]
MSAHIFEACLRGEAPEISHLPVLITAFNALSAMELYNISFKYRAHPVVAKIINQIIGEKVAQTNLNDSIGRILARYQVSSGMPIH